MRSRCLLVGVLLACLALPYSLPACSLCGTLSASRSIVYEYQEAGMVAFGVIANPKLGPDGKGTTEFQIDRILKAPAGSSPGKTLLLAQYLPVLDPKSPPKWVMFFQTTKAGLVPYWGRELPSVRVLEFASEVRRRAGQPDDMLLYAAKHFADADPIVADEAFLMFAKADDKTVARVAKRLSPEALRTVIKQPNIEPERLSMFTYLLGVCGTADDAETLRALLAARSSRYYKAYEGILAGYISLRPKQGWDLSEQLIADPKTEFLVRYAAMRTLRFFYNARPEETGTQVMRGWALALKQPDIADVAINDLRKNKRWEFTRQVLALYDQPGAQSPIVRGSIERYAIACPLPETRPLVEHLRKKNPDLVKELEADLKQP